MRPNAHAPRHGQARGALHGGFVAGVAAAGDVGGSDVLHQRGFMPGIFQLAQVAVEIENHASHRAYSHCSCWRSRWSACSMVTHSKRTSSRGRNLAETPEIGGDHVGGLGIPAGGLVLDEENDWLAIGRHLDRAQRHALGEHVAGGAGNGGATQAQAHAVGFLGHVIRGSVELAGKPVAPAARRVTRSGPARANSGARGRPLGPLRAAGAWRHRRWGARRRRAAGGRPPRS